MKALVTGAAGFVGRHLRAHLEAHGDDVVGVDRADGPDLLDADGRRRHRRRRPTRRRLPPRRLERRGRARGTHPHDAFRVNAEGTLNLLAGLPGRTAPAGCSSSAAPTSTAGSARRAAASPRTPRSARSRPTPPARSRPTSSASRPGSATASRSCGCGPSTTSARARPTAFVAPALAERIARNERDGADVVPVGNLTPRRDFTDVRDVVRAYRLLIDRTASRARPTTSAPGATSPSASSPSASSPWPPARCASRPTRRSSARSRRPCCGATTPSSDEATGWEPEIPLDQTLADLLDERRALVGATSA